jgi:hypothetical protein
VRRLVRSSSRGIAGVCIEDEALPQTNNCIRGRRRGGRHRRVCGRSGRRTPKITWLKVIVARVEAFIAGWGLTKPPAAEAASSGADAILSTAPSPAQRGGRSGNGERSRSSSCRQVLQDADRGPARRPRWRLGEPPDAGVAPAMQRARAIRAGEPGHGRPGHAGGIPAAGRARGWRGRRRYLPHGADCSQARARCFQPPRPRLTYREEGRTESGFGPSGLPS